MISWQLRARGHWKLALVAALLTSFATLPSGASALPEPQNESLSVTGSLTYVWHGDPARGCAREGLCDVQGSVIFQPDGSGDLFSGGPGVNVDLSGTSTVRVGSTFAG